MECTSKSGNADIVTTVMVKVGSPITLVIHSSGAAGWVASNREALSGWIDRRSKELDLRCVYSAGGCAVVRPLEPTSDFGRLRSKIRGFQQLEQGWDSYNAEAPSSQAVSAALKLVDELERADLLPEWVTTTGDSSILMRYRSGDVWFDWEFHSDGDVAVMRKPLFDRETYHDFSADGITSFFSRQSGTR